MKRYSAKLIAVILVLLLILSGCSSLIDSISDNLDSVTDQISDFVNTSEESEETPQTEDTTVSGSDTAAQEGSVAVSISALQRPSLFDGISSDTTDVTASVPSYTVASDLSNVYNLAQFYLNDTLKEMLAENLFAVMMDNSYEFYEVYESNRYNNIPNFVTTDSMMHTYHLYFSYLLKNTEKNYLADSLKNVTSLMVETSLAQYETLKCSEWETAALRNAAFFSVAASLLDVAADIPAEVQALADEELALIYAQAGIATSPIASLGLEDDISEDYTQYIVRGYYEGDETLEAYFRAMMWYGCVNFQQKTEDLDRSALLMTLAMDESGALSEWEAIYTVTSFFAGASDDLGYYEYKPVIDAVYDSAVTVEDLIGDEESWELFHQTTAVMDPPKINSVLTSSDDNTDTASNKGFRFMGQRFSIDETIFEQLVYSNVQENSDGDYRMLPDALDIPAALGSVEALEILEEKGATDYEGYTENLEKVQEALEEATDTLWEASLYSQWLHTLVPLLNEDREGYPAFMQSDEWTRKDLQTFLASYTELKHDTVLYSKQLMAEMGGDDVLDLDDRGYVEPEPVLYSRLASLVKATEEGLSAFGILSSADADNLELLYTLADSLAEISVKELANETLTDEEYELIRGFGGSLEHFWEEVYKDEGTSLTTKEFPAAIVTDIASNTAGSTLQVATGMVGTIYVIVPVDGTLKICVGSVYSFYEFEQPSSERLTDSTWRQMMGLELQDDGTYSYPPAYIMEDWTSGFQFSYYAS